MNTLFTLVLLLALPLLPACSASTDPTPDAVCGQVLTVPGSAVPSKVSCQNAAPGATADDAGVVGPTVYGWMVSCATAVDGEPQPIPSSITSADCQAVPTIDDTAPSPGTSWFCCTSGPFAADANP